jgi:phosphoserine aminotransferase
MFAVYIVGLVIEWIEAAGGLEALEKRNGAKAKLLYDAIEATDFYSSPVEREARSAMNVAFRLAGGNPDIEKEFIKDAAAAGIEGIGGHRSVGGIRVSLYNAVTLESVQTLVAFMRAFAAKRG